MPAVGSAFVELVLDQTRFSSGLSSAEGKLKSFGGSAGKTMTGFQKVSTAAFLGVGAAAVIGLGKAMEATQQLGEETMKLGRQLGLSAEDASRLISVGKDLGVGFDQLSVGFGIFEKKLVDGGKQFEKYGISLQNADGSQKTFNQLLLEAADKYKALGGGVAGTTFAMDVFGKSGKNLLPILAQGSTGIERLMKKSDELGTTLSGKTVRATHELAIQQRELQQAFLGVEVKVGQALIPVIQKLVPVFEFAAQHAGFLIAALGALATLKLVSSVAKMVGSVKTLGGSFIEAGAKKDAFAGNVTGKLIPAAEAGAVSVEGMATGAGAAGLSFVDLAVDAAALGGPLLILEGLMYTNKKAVEDLSKAAYDNQIALGNSSMTAQVAAGSWRALQAQAIGASHALDAVKKPADAAAGAMTTAAYEASQLAGFALSAHGKVKSLAEALADLAGMKKLKSKDVTHAWDAFINNTNKAGSKVQTLHGQIVRLPNGKIIDMKLPTYASVLAQLRTIHSNVEAIAGTYGIYYQIHYSGGGGTQRGAHGMVFPRFAGGSMFMGPGRVGAFQAGEGGYATPAGIGSEIASSRGVLPLDYATLGKLGDAISARMHGGGGPRIELHFHGPVAEETRAFARRLAPDLSRELGRIALVKRT